MNEQIDWSKAPEGATHWVQDLTPEMGDKYSGWAKFDGRVYNAFGGGFWVAETTAFAFIPRPAESTAWGGTGLPPVGTMCEVDTAAGRQQGTVVAHVTRDGARKAVVQGDDDWWSAAEWDLYPIRTPEQLAAEAREKAVIDLTQFLVGQRHCSEAYIAERLYDAGYRKVEAAE